MIVYLSLCVIFPIYYSYESTLSLDVGTFSAVSSLFVSCFGMEFTAVHVSVGFRTLVILTDFRLKLLARLAKANYFYPQFCARESIGVSLGGVLQGCLSWGWLHWRHLL